MAKLTLMLMVKNEADRYLRDMLDSASQYVDEIVILDDNSTDQTFSICASYPKVVRLERVKETDFATNESAPRIRLFEMTRETNPDWIICLDADEIMENRFIKEVQTLIDNPGGNYWFGIVFHHFWHSLTHYRVDKLWKPVAGPRMFKFLHDYKYEWRQSRLHCGSLPQNVFAMRGTNTAYRVKHLGYADGPKRTRQKYEWYIARDPNSELCPRSHYDSMLDPNPVLKRWID